VIVLTYTIWHYITLSSHRDASIQTKLMIIKLLTLCQKYRHINRFMWTLNTDFLSKYLFMQVQSKMSLTLVGIWSTLLSVQPISVSRSMVYGAITNVFARVATTMWWCQWELLFVTESLTSITVWLSGSDRHIAWSCTRSFARSRRRK